MDEIQLRVTWPNEYLCEGKGAKMHICQIKSTPVNSLDSRLRIAMMYLLEHSAL
jgi:hypothetical protein